MLSFLNTIKNKLDVYNLPLVPLNKFGSNTSIYSETLEETKRSKSAVPQTDTPLTINKTNKYESMINLSEIKNDKHKKKIAFSPDHECQQQPPNTKSSSVKKKSLKKRSIIQQIGLRLSARKDLRTKRRHIAYIMFVLGLIGILLMIGLIEFNFYHQFEIKKNLIIKNKFSNESPSYQETYLEIVLKCFISFSTIGLVFCVFIYHYVQTKIFCIDNSIEDWRIAVTPIRIFLILFECLVCSIHPIPGYLNVSFNSEVISTSVVNNTTITTVKSVTDLVPLNIILSIPMFARLYLLPRIVLLNSKLINDASSQSLGYLNRITFNFRFVFKAFMTQCPEYVLMILIFILFLITSWGLRACEYYADPHKFGLMNSMWFVAITFLTVG
jgi:potassium intermediate/small conductance calcium-activated channel subfamily N protein 3